MPFDFADYAEESRIYSDAFLERELRRYTRQCAAASTKGGVMVAVAPFTLGWSLLGAGASAATYANAIKKLDILQRELRRRRISVRTRKRDYVVPALAGGLIGPLRYH